MLLCPLQCQHPLLVTGSRLPARWPCPEGAFCDCGTCPSQLQPLPTVGDIQGSHRSQDWGEGRPTHLACPPLLAERCRVVKVGREGACILEAGILSFVASEDWTATSCVDAGSVCLVNSVSLAALCWTCISQVSAAECISENSWDSGRKSKINSLWMENTACSSRPEQAAGRIRLYVPKLNFH